MAFNAVDHGTIVRNKKPVLIIVFLLVCAILGATYYFCNTQYEVARQSILEEQDIRLQTRAQGIVRSVNLWVDDVTTQAKRVSSSDLYSLFAFEVQQLGNDVIGMLSTTDMPDGLSEDGAMVAQQIPLIRDVLLDYMNYSGMQDARIMNADGLTLLSALQRPVPLNTTQQFAIAKALATNSIAFAPIRDSLAGLVLDFADPIVPLDAVDAGSKTEVVLLLTTSVAGNIAQFLTLEQDIDSNIQARLVQRNGDVWEDVRPNATEPVPFVLPLNLDADVESLPFQKVISPDGKEHVYILGSKIEKLDWWIFTQVPESSVADELSSAAWTIYGIGLLISIGFILLLALLWWVIVGREQRTIANEFKDLYGLIKQQKHLLDCVNVSLDVGLFMTDTQGLIKVCNKAFADIMRKEEEALLDMQLSNLFDMDNVAKLLQAMRDVQESETTGSLELSLAYGEEICLLRVTLFPFLDKTSGGENDGIVGIMQDITEFRRRSKQHQLQQHNTIKALVQAIEGVDPYLSGHSQLMEKIASVVVKELKLDEKDANTITIASGLSQVGKLFVPRDLLTKSQGLSDAEHAAIMKVPEHAYQVLKNIDFGLPVAEAVYAMYEKMDGSGYPQSLEGDNIAIHARVLAVLNAFCAMTSPRSYRSGMSAIDAIAVLRKDTRTCDQNVVEALEKALCTPEGMAILQIRSQEVSSDNAS